MKTIAFSKSYGKKTVLDCPALDLPEGQITAVIGANGSGKSTLASVLAGIEASDQKRRVLSGLRIGYLPQKSYAFRMSASRNIALGGNDPARQKRLTEALLLEPLAKQSAKKLSGGETARMALARLLMGNYDLLILDEPTAAMDRESTLAAERLIKEYCAGNGCAVLLITHRIQQARRMADQVLFFCGGKLAEAGSTERILTAPACPETQRFLEFYGF